MSKIPYPAAIVVEGATDKALLGSFLDTEIIITNGSEVSRETIDYISNLSKSRQIVVLTDPDSPGKRIRDILDRNIPGLKHAFIPKEKAVKGHKVGVAECDRETILEALSFPLDQQKPKENPPIASSDLFDLGLVGHDNSFELREKVGAALHLGHGNAKTFLKRVNALDLTVEELREVIKKHG